MPLAFTGRYFDKHRSFFPYECKDYRFKVDLQNGELYFTRNLVSFSGKYLSLNLSLKYSQLHVNPLDNIFLHTGFPKGFKTNLDYPDDTHSENYYTHQRIGDIDFYYRINGGENYGWLSKTELEVYNSWKYTKEEIEVFLTLLKQQKGNEKLNILRVKNEWLWHNNAYNLGIGKESSKSVNAYFNYRDDNLLYALIFDLWWIG